MTDKSKNDRNKPIQFLNFHFSTAAKLTGDKSDIITTEIKLNSTVNVYNTHFILAIVLDDGSEY